MPDDELTLNTGDLTYPTVTAKIKATPYEKGITETDMTWRSMTYQVWDLVDVVAGRKSDLFMDALKGFTNPGTLTAWTLDKYVSPHRYPTNTKLWCVDARATHMGVARPAPNLHETNYVEITARYERIPYAIGTADSTDVDLGSNLNTSRLGDNVYPWVTIRKSKSSKTYRISRSSLKSGDDADSVMGDFQIQIPIITYHLTYHRVPWNGDDFDDILFGTTNNASVFGKAAGTLRYEGAEADPTSIGRGETGYDVTVDLGWNKFGWNHDIPLTKVNGEKVVFQDDETKTPYIPADYSVLELTLPILSP
jgi:hypothetical protein